MKSKNRHKAEIVFDRKEIPAKAIQVGKFTSNEASRLRWAVYRYNAIKAWKLCYDGDPLSTRGLLFVLPEEAQEYLNKNRKPSETDKPKVETSGELIAIHQTLLRIETLMQELLTRPVNNSQSVV
jgi:hypothetical protein